MSTTGTTTCEVCGAIPVRAWGWDGSLLCATHYRIADERYAAAEQIESCPVCRGIMEHVLGCPEQDACR